VASEEGAVRSAQGAREKADVAQLSGEYLRALVGEGLGLCDAAYDGANLVACGKQVARDDGTNVTGGTCDDEDGHGLPRTDRLR
jgi:hypothetical protein